MGSTFFARQLRTMPDSLSLTAFYLSQGYSDAMIAQAISKNSRNIRAYVMRIREHVGFDGSRINLALEILHCLD